jgi:lactobin A/cerein 7B family class IIb bacteriocin
MTIILSDKELDEVSGGVDPITMIVVGAVALVAGYITGKTGNGSEPSNPNGPSPQPPPPPTPLH